MRNVAINGESICYVALELLVLHNPIASNRRIRILLKLLEPTHFSLLLGCIELQNLENGAPHNIRDAEAGSVDPVPETTVKAERNQNMAIALTYAVCHVYVSFRWHGSNIDPK